MKSRHYLLLIMAMLIAFPYCSKAQFNAADSLGDAFSETPEYLQVDEAFRFDFNQQGDQLIVSFDIAEGYYLYRKQFKTVTKDATLGEPHFPQGVMIEDEFFGESEVYFNRVSFTYPIEQAQNDAVVKLRYQGCAEAGLCYPPTVQVIYLTAVGTASDSQTAPIVAEEVDTFAPQNAITQLAEGSNLAVTLGIFFLLGIGLAFTPCVFPMYPILSAIVLGRDKRLPTGRALSLSTMYVQGMALTYSLLGLVIASAGFQFQVALQHPAILWTMVALFVVLSLAMFGVYQIQLPARWQEKLNAMSNQQSGGSMFGVFIMGALSGLIASPCTTAPLTAILLFIAQSGDLTLGFVSLYILSLGMGLPLIVFAVTGGKLLPKAGQWMDVIKTTFGFLMLAVAIVFIERLWISPYSTLLWALLAVAAASYFSVKNQTSADSAGKVARTFVIYTLLLVGGLLGYQVLTDASGKPVQQAATTKATHPEFVRVKDLNDFKQKLAAANAAGKTVMVDLYADWCVACKEFEKYTFPDPQVIKALDNTEWLQIDLTDNTPVNIEFQKAFSVLGLPTILFFSTNGEEIPRSRVTGFMRAEPFAQHVKKALSQ